MLMLLLLQSFEVVEEILEVVSTRFLPKRLSSLSKFCWRKILLLATMTQIHFENGWVRVDGPHQFTYLIERQQWWQLVRWFHLGAWHESNFWSVWSMQSRYILALFCMIHCIFQLYVFIGRVFGQLLTFKAFRFFRQSLRLRSCFRLQAYVFICRIYVEKI